MLGAACESSTSPAGWTKPRNFDCRSLWELKQLSINSGENGSNSHWNRISKIVHVVQLSGLVVHLDSKTLANVHGVGAKPKIEVCSFGSVGVNDACGNRGSNVSSDLHEALPLALNLFRVPPQRTLLLTTYHPAHNLPQFARRSRSAVLSTLACCVMPLWLAEIRVFRGTSLIRNRPPPRITTRA